MLKAIIVTAFIIGSWILALALCRAAARGDEPCGHPMGNEAADPERTREDSHAA